MTHSDRSTTDSSPRRPIVHAARAVHPQAPFAVVTTLAGLALVVGFACSSTAPAAEEWTASYVDPPDRVWATINQTLDTLGYDIEEADRHESIIVASLAADETSPAVTLRIAQVAHTEVVRVHVSPLDGNTDTARYQAAAREFLAALDATMKGVARPEESNDS